MRSTSAIPRIRTKSDEWLIVAYEVPYKPSKFRVKMWRDLTSRGGLYTQMSFCILPYSTKNVSKLQVIRKDVASVGKMLLLRTEEMTESDNIYLRELMNKQSERQYLEILEEGQEFLDEVKSNRRNNVYREEEIKELDESMEALHKWYDKTVLIDMQKTSPARSKVKELLVRCQKNLDTYATEVEMQRTRALEQISSSSQCKSGE